MTRDEWSEQFLAASAELSHIAAERGGVFDPDVTEREGELLELIDELEFVGGAKCRSGEWQ